MKTGDLWAEWDSLLTTQGPDRAVDAIREVLLRLGQGTAFPIRVLELLLVTSKPEQSTALVDAIRADARRLRGIHGNASVDQIRIAVIEGKKRELEAQLVQRSGEGEADPNVQHRIGMLADDESSLGKSISQLRGENERLTQLLMRMD